ncbi:serine/threonine-protein kinase PknK [Arthrobacter sp. Hiyo6]|nr:serine/threonine-protein kinase PknK [Arthrobacter sp. Hiyo6]
MDGEPCLPGPGYRLVVLGPDDNNTIWFLSHLLQAIRKAWPGLEEELQQLLEERPDDAEQYVVPALINAIDERGRDIVITLDDWHLVTEPRTRAVVERLLEAGGSHLSFIITSRVRSGLPLGRLMVRDQLLEVDALALRFDETESQDFLVGINRLDLDAGDVASLHRTTEGWIAALQLVSLSLRGHREASELIERLSGRHASIGEYLAENVLDTLDPETLDFLLMTSVPERLCAGLRPPSRGWNWARQCWRRFRHRIYSCNRLTRTARGTAITTSLRITCAAAWSATIRAAPRN